MYEWVRLMTGQTLSKADIEALVLRQAGGGGGIHPQLIICLHILPIFFILQMELVFIFIMLVTFYSNSTLNQLATKEFRDQ